MEPKKSIPLAAITFGLSLGAAAAGLYSPSEAEACYTNGDCLTCTGCYDGFGQGCQLCNLDNYTCYIDGQVQLCL